jgi:hypothetical protein
MLTTLLDLLGVALVAGFVWFVWPPLVLLVLGAAALALSWSLNREDAK